MKKRAFRSIAELARAAGVHRNTVHYYLSGRPLLPAKLERILEQLRLRLDQAVVKVEPRPEPGLAQIAPLVDRLHDRFPDATWVLFGSRTRPAHARYADWDLGVFCRDGLPHARFREMRVLAAEEAEHLPVHVDLVNLNRAGVEFLRQISRSWAFLAGRQGDWLQLQERARRGG